LVDRVIVRNLRLWCVLVLAAIFGHALLPVGSPEARQSGSPFSASTVDVSTGLSRRAIRIEHVRSDFDPDDVTGKLQPVPQWAPQVVQPIPLDLATLPNLDAMFEAADGWEHGCRTPCSMPRAPPTPESRTISQL
jgi:hypothetical protein